VIDYDFDVTKTEQIFDLLLKEKQFELTAGHQIPLADQLKGHKYWKWHNTIDSHQTVDCKALRQQIQNAIEQGRLVYLRNQMKVDKMPFPSTNMVDVAPAPQQPSPRDSSASFQRMWNPFEQGRVIARTPRGENDACLSPTINMVSVAHSSKGERGSRS
jgi:hypothetical protein